MPPFAKIAFAVVSSAISIGGRLTALKQARAQANLQTALVEKEAQAAALEGEAEQLRLVRAYGNTTATQIALMGASGAMMYGGSNHAILQRDYTVFQQDYSLLETRKRLAFEGAQGQKAMIGLGYGQKALATKAAIAGDIFKLGSTAGETYGWGANDPTSPVEIGSGGTAKASGGYTGGTG